MCKYPDNSARKSVPHGKISAGFHASILANPPDEFHMILPIELLPGGLIFAEYRGHPAAPLSTNESLLRRKFIPGRTRDSAPGRGNACGGHLAIYPTTSISGSRA